MALPCTYCMYRVCPLATWNSHECRDQALCNYRGEWRRGVSTQSPDHPLETLFSLKTPPISLCGQLASCGRSHKVGGKWERTRAPGIQVAFHSDRCWRRQRHRPLGARLVPATNAHPPDRPVQVPLPPTRTTLYHSVTPFRNTSASTAKYCRSRGLAKEQSIARARYNVVSRQYTARV